MDQEYIIKWSMNIDNFQYGNIFIDNNDNIFIYGEKYENNNFNQIENYLYKNQQNTCDFTFLTKYDSNGLLVWSKSYPYGFLLYDIFESDSIGFIYPLLYRFKELSPHQYPIFNCQKTIFPSTQLPYNDLFYIQKIDTKSGELMPIYATANTEIRGYLLNDYMRLLTVSRPTIFKNFSYLKPFDIYKIKLSYTK
jgi:hypothetical protein